MKSDSTLNQDVYSFNWALFFHNKTIISQADFSITKTDGRREREREREGEREWKNKWLNEWMNA